MNVNMENLGARRLHSIIEKVVEDISYKAPNFKGKDFIIDR
jgi:ATP-dependent HslUV protease ATP-binding subunit HslU